MTPWKIPPSWSWSTTGEVATVTGGGTPRTDDSRNYVDGRVPWITPADLSGYRNKTIARGGRDITLRGLETSGARLIPAGSVLFSCRAPIGYVAIAATDLSTNQGFKSFTPKSGILSDYLYYFLQRAKEIAISLASGTTFLEISGKKAGEIPIPIAPTNEQRRIAAEIERQFTRLDTANKALARAAVNLKRYRTSMLKAACSGSLVINEAEKDPRHYEPATELLTRILDERRVRWEMSQVAKNSASDKKSKQWKKKYVEPTPPDFARLPELPAGWTWTNIGQLATVGTGATPKRGEIRYYQNGKIAWVTSSTVNKGQVTEATEFVTRAALEETNLTVFPPNTLLLAMYGEGKTRGKVAELMIEAATNQALAAISLSREASKCKNFVKLALEHNYEAIRAGASGGVQPNLNLDIVRAIPIALPPLAEQARIVEATTRLLTNISHTESELQKQAARALSLRQSVLREAFAGHIVTQNAKDEPASILLEHIRSEPPTRKPGGSGSRPQAAFSGAAR